MFCIYSASSNTAGLRNGCNRSNKLVDLPDELAELGQLHTLRCKYNLLQRLPAVLARLPLLTTLVHLLHLIYMDCIWYSVPVQQKISCVSTPVVVLLKLMCLSGSCSRYKSALQCAPGTYG